MNAVLESHTAFKSKYVNNPILSKLIRSCLLGLGSSAAVIGTATAVVASTTGTVAATTGLAGIAGHLTGLPFIGGLASSYVSTVTAACDNNGNGNCSYFRITCRSCCRRRLSWRCHVNAKKKDSSISKKLWT